MAGKIFRITKFVERRKTPFTISRLIMHSGISVRNYNAASPDDDGEILRLMSAAETVLSPTELEELKQEIE